MSEQKNRLILAAMTVGIVVLIIMNMNLSRRIGNMEASLYSTQNMLTGNLNNNLYSINQTISAKIDALDNKLTQDAKLTYDETTTIRDYQQESSSAHVDVAFNLKQFNPQDTVTVVARGIDGKTFDATAKGTDTGRFTAAITLPVQDNYVLSFTSTGEENISGELTTLNIAEELCERFKYSYGTSRGTYSNPDQPTVLKLYPQLTNYTRGNDALKIKEIFLIAESNGTELERWDLLPLIQDSVDSQTIDEYHRQAQIASGEIEATENENGSEVEFVLPDSDYTIRLLFTDNMGVKYEQTDRVTNVGLGDSQGGGSSSSSIVPSKLTGSTEHGDGYIHFAN